MTAGADLLAKVTPWAQMNSQRCRVQSTSILEKHLESLLPNASAAERRVQAERLYSDYRDIVSRNQHVSINISIQRVTELSRSGIITPTVPPNQYDKLPRDNVEKVFWDGNLPVRPVYGALNTTSPIGAAPDFNPKIWIRIQGTAVAAKTTFTSRNTYHILNPALGDFDSAKALLVLQREVFVWDNVADCFLAKFGHPDALRTEDFVEAQIWGGVDLDDIDAIFVSKDIRDELITSVTAKDCIHSTQIVATIQEIP